MRANRTRVSCWWVRKYRPEDPTGVGNRGYFNTHTGQPWGSYQPYARNVAQSLRNEHAIFRGRNPNTTTLFQHFDFRMARKFYDKDKKFILELMRHRGYSVTGDVRDFERLLNDNNIWQALENLS